MMAYSPPIPRPPWDYYKLEMTDDLFGVIVLTKESFTKADACEVRSELIEWFPDMKVSLISTPQLPERFAYE